jgi:BioD-like phosphotransacetylase family protein
LINLLITSRFKKAGKTMVSAGLIGRWLKNGQKVAYRKYSGLLETNPGEDPDSTFISKILNTNDSNLQENNILVSECNWDTLSSLLTEKPDYKVLVVHDFTDSLSEAAAEYQKIKMAGLGLVVNKIPRKDMEVAKNKFAVSLGIARISLIGLIPEDRILMALSVADIAQAVHGNIVNSSGNASDLVENLMIGSSTFDRGPVYYGRKNNKAVILWGDRPGFRKAAVANLQQAALQTSTRCIIVGNNVPPLPAAIQKADEQKVSIISAPGTLPEIVAAIEKAFQNPNFGQNSKLTRLNEILENNLDLQKLDAMLGIQT